MGTEAELLAELGIEQHNAGACFGPDWLGADQHFPSINPANGRSCLAGRCSEVSTSRFCIQRSKPQLLARFQPRRGELVRLIVEICAQVGTRQPDRPETGKIKEEGDGEVRDDRHRRVRSRPVAHAVWADHALGAPAASDV